MNLKQLFSSRNSVQRHRVIWRYINVVFLLIIIIKAKSSPSFVNFLRRDVIGRLPVATRMLLEIGGGVIGLLNVNK